MKRLLTCPICHKECQMTKREVPVAVVQCGPDTYGAVIEAYECPKCKALCVPKAVQP